MTVIVDIGTLRQVATLSERGTPAATGDGDYTAAYTPENPAEWRCAIERASASNSQRHFAQTVIAYGTYVMRGRYHAGITTTTRVTWTDRGGIVHVADVIDVVDTEGAGVETVILAVEQADPAAP